MTRDEESNLLIAGARDMGWALGAPPAATLLRLLDELEAANARFNLTAFLRGTRFADVGTGAGFPGLPLAIVNPARRFVLIEATGKKARFVMQTALRLGLTNVEVVHARAESYRPPQLFDAVMARALSSLEDFVGHAGHLCLPGGRLLAMKGKRPDDELDHLPKSHRVLAVHRLRLPGLADERHLVELSGAAPDNRKP
jgi:16S rRNA (guanine527-N7)-methyltransferase